MFVIIYPEQDGGINLLCLKMKSFCFVNGISNTARLNRRDRNSLIPANALPHKMDTIYNVYKFPAKYPLNSSFSGIQCLFATEYN